MCVVQRLRGIPSWRPDTLASHSAALLTEVSTVYSGDSDDDVQKTVTTEKSKIVT